MIDNVLLEKSVGTKRFELRNEIPAAKKGIADKEYRRLLCEDPWPVTESGDGLEIPDEIDERVTDLIHLKIARNCVREGISPEERWHMRLGHINLKRMKKIEIPGVKFSAKNFRCDACFAWEGSLLCPPAYTT